MSLTGRMKILVNTHVNLNDPALEPAPTAFGQFDRFWYFNHTQKVAKKDSRGLFLADGHRQLKVINGTKRVVVHRLILSTAN
jgi:hypothetical protein